jgi:hypothetical protein
MTASEGRTTDMKLGEVKDFYALRKADTEQFYSEFGNPTENLLEARLAADRDAIDKFQQSVLRASISKEGTTPILERVRIRITITLSPFP